MWTLRNDFYWSDFFELAKDLAHCDSPNEAYKRSAIGRAYYAIYCSARNRLIDGGIYIKANADAHQEVCQTYDRSKDFEAKRIAATLDRMRIHRNSADYDDVFQGDLDKALDLTLSRAAQALTFIDQLTNRQIDEMR